MAGLFGLFDFSKPGPGVPKDGPPKPRIVVFMEILSRKFWNLIKLNFMFLIFNIPAIIAMFFVSQFFWPSLIADDAFVDFTIRLIFGSIFMCIPILTVGPAQAGFTYILRNYAREEHAFVWWDFKDAAKANFKQSIIISLIDLVITTIVCIDLNLYRQVVQNTVMRTLGTTFLVIAIIIYVMMHLYIYPMLITFNLSIKQIYKNAFIFAVVKFFPNFLVLILNVALIMLAFYFNSLIGFLVFFLILFSLTGLINNFYVDPILNKYMTGKNSVQIIEDQNQEKIFSDKNLLDSKRTDTNN